MTLKQLLRMIFASRWTILMCVLASLAGTLLISDRLPKSYEAHARVILELIRADPVTGVMYNPKQSESYVQTQQLLVMSDRVAGRVIDKLGWATNPAVIEAWQQQSGGFGDIRQWAAERLVGSTAAYPLEGGGILEIAYRAPDPDAAFTVTKMIREAYIETSLALQTEASARRAERYEKLAKAGRESLRKAELELIAAQRETGTLLNPTGHGVDDDDLRVLSTSAQNAEMLALRRTRMLESLNGSILQGQLRRAMVANEQQIARTANTLGADNPDYKALLERRAQLAGQISAAGSAARAAASASAADARRIASAPQQAYQEERERVLNNAPANLRISTALRIVKLREGELKRLEANVANAQLIASRTESGLVVMGDVISNPDPVSPDIPLNALLASLFGLGLGLAWATIEGLSRREVLGSSDLAVASGVPVLVVLPSESRSRFASLVRWLQVRLRRGSGGTSPAPA